MGSGRSCSSLSLMSPGTVASISSSCRSLVQDSKQHIVALQRRERERTGISSLKIRYNKVFGYYIEVTRSKLDAVPEEYVRKQTLVNAERFVTPEVKELEESILTAEQRQLELEAEYFVALQRRIVDHRQGLLDSGASRSPCSMCWCRWHR